MICIREVIKKMEETEMNEEVEEAKGTLDSVLQISACTRIISVCKSLY